jgi:hypothetical protein
MGRNELRGKVYLVLAELIQEPDKRLHVRLITGEIADFLEQSLAELGYNLQVPAGVQQENLLNTFSGPQPLALGLNCLIVSSNPGAPRRLVFTVNDFRKPLSLNPMMIIGYFFALML